MKTWINLTPCWSLIVKLNWGAFGIFLRWLICFKIANFVSFSPFSAADNPNQFISSLIVAHERTPRVLLQKKYRQDQHSCVQGKTSAWVAEHENTREPKRWRQCNDLASVDDPSGAEFPGGFDVPAVQVVAHASLHSAHLEQRISYAHKYKNNNKQTATFYTLDQSVKSCQSLVSTGSVCFVTAWN